MSADLGKWLGKVTCGDCLEVLRELPDCSVDSVITDPPYGISSFSITRVRSVRGAERRPDGMCVFNNAGGDYGPEDIEAGHGWIEQVARVLRPGGTFVVFCSQRQFQPTRDFAESVGLQVRTPWFWTKTNPPPTPRENFCSAVEFGWWFFKPGGAVVWNGGHKQPNYWSGPLYSGTFASGKRYHPMQKPEWLIRDMVQLWTEPGGIVLDPFVGSGTTAVAAVLEGRQFIGIEKDPAYCELSRARIADAIRNHQPTLQEALDHA